MPYINPSYAALGDLEDFLAKQEAQKRQTLLDSLNQQQQSQQMSLAQQNADALTEQRQQAAAANQQRQALAVAGLLAPGQAIDPSTAGTLRTGGFGSLVDQTLPATQTVTAAPLPGADDQTAVTQTTQAPDLLTYRGSADQQQRLAEAQQRQQTAARILADPNTPDMVKSFVTANPDTPVPYQLYAAAQGNEVKQQLADISNAFKQKSMDIQQQALEGRISHAAALMQLQQQNADLNHQLMSLSAQSDVRTSPISNTPFVSLSGMSGKTKDLARANAKAAGAVPLEAKDADKLAGIGAVQQQLQDYASTYLPKLATSATGRIGTGLKNELASITQSDGGDMNVMGQHWIDLVGILKGAVGGGGVRITQSEINKLLGENAISKFDTQSTGQKKIDYLTNLLKGEEQGTLGITAPTAADPMGLRK